MKPQKLIDSVDQIPAGAKLCLYGAGGFGVNLFHIVRNTRPDLQVTCFGDTFKRGAICDLPILTPEQAAAEHGQRFDTLLVTTADVSRDAILQTLATHAVQSVWAGSTQLQADVFFKNVLDGRFNFNQINMEVTGRCNMACRFCGFRNRKTADMDFGLYKQIVSQIADADLSRSIVLAGGGEPLLYTRLPQAVALARKHDFFVNIITNGLSLSPQVMRDLDGRGLNLLTVSLHNLSSPTFVYRHAGIDYDTYRGKIMAAVSTHASRDMKMGLQLAVMTDRPEGSLTTATAWGLPAVTRESEKLKSLLDPFLADLKAALAGRGSINKLTTARFYEAARDRRQIALTDRIKLTFVGLDANQRVKRRYLRQQSSSNTPDCPSEIRLDQIRLDQAQNGSCHNYLQNPQILYDGTVLPCCTDAIDSELALGRIDEDTTLLDLFRGDTYRQLIKGFEKNELKMPACRICMGALVRNNTNPITGREAA